MADIIQLTSKPVRVPAAVSGTSGKAVSDPADMVDVSGYDAVDLEATIYGGATSTNVGSLTLYTAMDLPKSSNDVDKLLAATGTVTLTTGDTGTTPVLAQGPGSGKALLRYLGWKVENSSSSDFVVSIRGVARRSA